ncbi:uncharacterized protein LOC127749621 [Frankliniella occidentalis]|uniref:Uncharacterized protein LOC127749621 n=1 Tax=Frankliniella occidentalis TaxID=133901 RepID=A0A9C6WYL7_FRAOC|nr:uncharacterized protein LOC127749621 [Frankliniella occidentalis]
MIKIKLAISFSALAVLFDVTVQTCCNYFYDTVGILSKVLHCMVFWADKEDVLKNLPKCFNRYKCTRVVLDCFEVAIEKSKCIQCRVRSYSHYKKNNTAKFLVLITPSGLVSHMCPAFGGRASDKCITEHSGIYQLCDPGDGIMVDIGYDIDQECLDNMLKLIRPTFLRKSRQFTRAESVECAKIARARVHVERLIQRIRQYQILKNKVPWCIIPYLDDIAVIVSALVN